MSCLTAVCRSKAGNSHAHHSGIQSISLLVRVQIAPAVLTMSSVAVFSFSKPHHRPGTPHCVYLPCLLGLLCAGRGARGLFLVFRGISFQVYRPAVRHNVPRLGSASKSDLGSRVRGRNTTEVMLCPSDRILSRDVTLVWSNIDDVSVF